MNDHFEKIVFIILNYNCSKLTIECYNSLKKLNNNIKIIIVDNASNDDDKEQLVKLKKDKNTILLMNNKNDGYAMGNNVALKYVEKNMKDITVSFIMNPDIRIEKIKYIDKMYMKLLKEEKLALITSMTIFNGKYRLPNDSCWKFLDKNQVVLNSSLIGKLISKSIKYSELELEGDIAYVDVVQGCFFAIKMDVVKKIGFLDEHTFLYCEEQILGRKIQKIGMKSGVLVDAFVYHNHLDKDKSMNNKRKRIFHLKCLKDSRKVIVKNYLGLNVFQIVIRNVFLDLDFFFKKIFILLRF